MNQARAWQSEPAIRIQNVHTEHRTDRLELPCFDGHLIVSLGSRGGVLDGASVEVSSGVPARGRAPRAEHAVEHVEPLRDPWRLGFVGSLTIRCVPQKPHIRTDTKSASHSSARLTGGSAERLLSVKSDGACRLRAPQLSHAHRSISS